MVVIVVMVPSQIEPQLGSLCLWISLSLISTSTPLCLRCWKRRSTNLWPSGAAPWNPDCRTGFFPFDQTRKSRGVGFDNFLIRTAPDSWIHCSQWHLKNQILENSNYFLFCISLTDWAALHDVSADFPNCEVTLPLHRLQPELLFQAAVKEARSFWMVWIA